MASPATPSRVGDINAGGTPFDELFLKQFAGEVLATFEESNRFLPRTMVRTITSGKSA